MPAEAIRINRRVLLQCSIGAPGLKQPFAQPQQNGALSALREFATCVAKVSYRKLALRFMGPVWADSSHPV